MDNLSNQTACAILAGGKSSRMGTNKALLRLDGKPLVSHVAETVRSVFDRVVLIADDRSPYAFLGIEIYSDVFKECGPLGGMHSAFVHTDTPALLVVSCDTPFITRDLLRHVLDFPTSAQAKVPEMDGRVQPLCGWYSREILPSLVKRLETKQLRVLEFLEEIGAERVLISPDLPFYSSDLFANLNAPGDHLRAGNRS